MVGKVSLRFQGMRGNKTESAGHDAGEEEVRKLWLNWLEIC
jgi:hypothetical protein